MEVVKVVWMVISLIKALINAFRFVVKIKFWLTEYVSVQMDIFGKIIK